MRWGYFIDTTRRNRIIAIRSLMVMFLLKRMVFSHSSVIDGVIEYLVWAAVSPHAGGKYRSIKPILLLRSSTWKFDLICFTFGPNWHTSRRR